MRGGYRPGAGRKPGSKNKKHGKTPEQHIIQGKTENLDPLTYMLKVMNDPSEDEDRRDKMAIAACPYCHARATEKGKKEELKERAKKAGSGRFSTGKPPLKLIK